MEAEQDKLRLTAGMFATVWNLAHPLVKIYSIYLIFLLKIPSSGILKGLELHQEVFRCPGSAWRCGSCGQSVLCPRAAAPSCVGVFLLPGASEPKRNLRPVLSPFIYSTTLCRSQTFRGFSVCVVVLICLGLVYV